MSSSFIRYKIERDCCGNFNNIEQELKEIKILEYIKFDSLNNILSIQTNNPSEFESILNKLDINFTKVDDDVPKNIAFLSKEFYLILSLFIIYAFSLIALYIGVPSNVEYGIFAILGIIYIISGKDVFKGVYENAKGLNFFTENSLMFAATISAFAIGFYAEGVAVMLFVKLGEYLEGYAIAKSKENINSLFSSTPNYANLNVNGEFKKVLAKDLKLNQEVLIKVGETVPIDCEIVNGHSNLNLAALNGESEPRFFKKGDILKQGAINLDGVLTCRVVKSFEDSSISIIKKLIEDAFEKKARTEKFITTFARFYTPAVFGICIFIAFACPFIFGGEMDRWIYRGLIALMVSCPCALVVSIPMGYFSALGVASKNGILIKGSSYLDVLNNLKFIAFDKTGTLTKGEFTLKDIKIIDGDRDYVLSLAKSIQSHSNHPIALAFKDLESKENIVLKNIEEIKANGMRAAISGDSGGVEVMLGSNSFLKNNGVDFESNLDSSLHLESSKYSEVYLSIDKQLAAIFYLSDNLKEDTISQISALKKLGVKNMHILSGDNESRTKEIAHILGIGYDAALSPEQKMSRFSTLMKDIKDNQKGAGCAFVGDGINDSVALKLSDVGFSIGSKSSDLSKQSSDIILMKDSIGEIVKSIQIAKKTRAIIWQNIIFALAIKIGFIALGLGDVATLWEAVFGDVGVSMLALLNASRITRFRV